jgi:hypothetical protein
VAGVFNGQAYDFIQRNIRGNHLSLVNEGRAGADIAVLDHAEHADFGSLTFSLDAKDLIMTTETKVAGEAEAKDAEVAPAAAPAAPDMMAALNTLITMVSKLVKFEEAEAKAETTEPVVDAETAEKPAAMDAAALTKQVMQDIAMRDTLAASLSAHVGTFDHKDKTLNEVAAYGVEKLGLQVQAGSEVATLTGFLAGAAKTKQASGMDAAIAKPSSLADLIKKGA